MPQLDVTPIISNISATQRTQNTEFALKLVLQTPYGLLISINQNANKTSLLTGLLNVSMSDGSLQDPGTTPADKTESPGYKYRLSPRWGPGFLWYDTEWHGTPRGEYMVDYETLKARYGKAWSDAYDAWTSRYIKAFVEYTLDPEWQHHPCPALMESKTWALDGMMLAAWLCLQPDVESVEYAPGFEKVMFQKEGLVETMKSFLEHL
ncbi:hypothetical protein O1611_g3260 [Lasiodiplodia mahajangana]|uniref:Uncharacterized protein n=1 Tax=Lasiodiplodia mahajangana TaxID=1108764 RepID=A0ACC2JSB6_9PEZI|nr:hypothetical protein O1611_g3260 [Lasiodiplodia mahajangana]